MDAVTLTCGGHAEYRVRHVGDCVLIFGSVPMSAMSVLTKLVPRNSVIDPNVADMLGANLAFGPRKELDALRSQAAGPAVAAARRAHASTGLSEGALEWLGAGERGLSSNALFTCLTGVSAVKHEGDEARHPYDPADWRRCELMLERCGLADQLQRARGMSPTWDRLVEAWPAIRDLFIAEAGPKWRERDCAWRAPRTYQLIKQALKD